MSIVLRISVEGAETNTWLTCITLRCDSSQLDADRMLRLLVMVEAVPIPANPAKLLTSAA